MPSNRSSCSMLGSMYRSRKRLNFSLHRLTSTSVPQITSWGAWLAAAPPTSLPAISYTITAAHCTSMSGTFYKYSWTCSFQQGSHYLLILKFKDSPRTFKDPQISFSRTNSQGCDHRTIQLAGYHLHVTLPTQAVSIRNDAKSTRGWIDIQHYKYSYVQNRMEHI